MADKITVPQLQQMKRDGQKIVGVVAWDYQMARIADRAGVEIMSVGDSVGINLWGQSSPLAVTMDQMLTVATAVRRGTSPSCSGVPTGRRFPCPTRRYRSSIRRSPTG